MEEKILNKIMNAETDVYVIFFDYGCRYSENALELLRKSNVKYKGYQIADIQGGLTELTNILAKNSDKMNYDISHKTKPVIFFNRKFIGGYTELNNLLH